jgi:hypothetical protein
MILVTVLTFYIFINIKIILICFTVVFDSFSHLRHLFILMLRSIIYACDYEKFSHLFYLILYQIGFDNS